MRSTDETTATKGDEPIIAIGEPSGRRLLALDIVDGQLVATYDPADLDEAARIFVDELLRRVRIAPLDGGRSES